MKKIILIALGSFSLFCIMTYCERNDSPSNRPAATVTTTTVPASKPIAIPPDITVSFLFIEDNSRPTLAFALTNTSGKNIKAIKGYIVALDQFGDAIGSPLGVTIDEPLSENETRKEEGRWYTDERLIHLLAKSPKDVAFKWHTSKVAF